jgi:hypothetical protein
VRASDDCSSDLVEMGLHGFSVGEGPAKGLASAAPTSRAGQLAPNRKALSLRWLAGWRGRVPRLAH